MVFGSYSVFGVALMPTNGASYRFGQLITLDAAPGGGTAPYTVAFYTNGDWLGTLDSAPFTNPVFGQDNYVYVRARNRGTQPTGPVTVALYYADPATSLAFPADWKDLAAGQIPGRGLYQRRDR